MRKDERKENDRSKDGIVEKESDDEEERRGR